MKALGTYKDFEVSPLDGAFDARTQSGKLNFYDFRLILNMGMSEDRKRCRLGGWRRLLAESPFGFENQDFHDQLAHCQFYYPSYEETIRGGGLVSGFTYPYWFPEMTEYDGYYDVVTPGYPFGEEIPQFENPFSYDRFYCGTERMLRGGCREAITLLYEATSISGQRKLIAGTKSRLAVLNERSGNWRLIGDGLGGPYSVDSNCGCSSRRFKVAQLGNIIVFTNDFDPVLYWSFDSGPEGCNIWSVDYIQELLLLNITRARSAVEWKGFLFVANVEVAGERHPNRIYWSDFNNPLSFFPGGESLAGFQELGLGERILGMQPIGGQLRIYTSKGKEKAIYEVALVGGSEVFNFNEIYHGPDGLEYEYSLVNTGNAHFYLGESGIFVLGEYDRLPQRVEWIHKSDGVIYKGVPGEWVKDFDGLNGFGGINKFACDHAVGGFDSEQKNIWFSWPTDDNECPNMSLIINPIYNHASLVDHGFTAFTMHRPDYTNTVRNWLAEFAGCDPASFLMEKEGVPYEWETPAAPPLYIRNETEDPNLPPHPDSLCARLSGITLEDLCEACDAESVFVMASALDKTLKEFTPHLCYRERYRGDTPVYGIGYEPGFPYEFLYEYAYVYGTAYEEPAPDVEPPVSTATGPYYGLAFSSDSDRLCAPRASTGFFIFTNSKNEVWQPETSLLADLADMRVSGGAAWCPSNNLFYVGLQGHGGTDIDAEGRMNGDELCAAVNPVTHSIEYIGGFPVVDSGGSYPSRARKAVYIPTTDRIWLQLFATAPQFAIINPADHSVTFLSDPLLAAIGADLWTYCPVNDSVYCSSSNKVVKIDASTLAVSQVDISAAVPPYPASPGPGDSGWVTVNTGGIDYVPDANSTSGGNVNKVWCVVYGVFRTFGQSDINSGQMVTIDPANADAIGNAGGANAATPNFLWYAPTVHRVLHRAGLNNNPLSAINPDTGAQKNFLPPFYPQLVLPTTYGAFCSSVNKIALPVQADNDLKFLFFSQADLTP